MPVFTETKTPYEFLIRWNESGVLQGAHVQWLEQTLRDGVVIASKVTVAEKVAILDGDNTGFNLSDLVGQVLLDQQNTIDAQAAQIQALQAQLAG